MTTEIQKLMHTLSGKNYLNGAYVASQGERADIVDPATEHVDAGNLRLADDRVRRLTDGAQILMGNVHRRCGEGDQVLCHGCHGCVPECELGVGVTFGGFKSEVQRSYDASVAVA